MTKMTILLICENLERKLSNTGTTGASYHKLAIGIWAVHQRCAEKSFHYVGLKNSKVIC